MTTGYGRPDRQLGRRDFVSFVPALVIFISTLSACILTLFFSLISIVLFPCTSVRENTRTWVPHSLLAYWMVLAFFARRNTPYFCLSVACQKQNDKNNCCLPQPPHRRQNFKNIFIKYLDSLYRLGKATQGCGFSFSNVICIFLYIINKYHLTFNIVLWYTRHSWEVSAVTSFHE